MRGKRRRQRKRITALLLAVIMLFFIMTGQSVKVMADEVTGDNDETIIENVTEETTAEKMTESDEETIDDSSIVSNEGYSETTDNFEPENDEIVNNDSLLGDPIDITGTDYSQNERGDFEFVIDANNAATYANVGNIIVPEGCILTIFGANVTVSGTITLESNSLLNIFNDEDNNAVGSLSGTFNPSVDARMMFTDDRNIPTGFTLYDSDQTTPFNTTDIIWTEFIYTEGNKWCIPPFDPFHFNLNIDGLITETDAGRHYASYKLSYSLDGGISWINAFENDDRVNLDNQGFVIIDEAHEDNAYLDFRIDDTNFTDDVMFKFEVKDTPIDEGYAEKGIELAFLSIDGGADYEDENNIFLKNLPNTTFTDRSSITFTMSDLENDIDNERHNINFALTYPNQGMSSIEEIVKENIYAYSVPNTVDVESNALSTQLYRMFFVVPMYGEFGILRADVDGRTDYEAFEDGKNELCGRITFKQPGTPITVINNGGTEATRTVNIYTVNLGYNEIGAPVSFDIPVIHLDNNNEILICIDMDNEAGLGETYYSRIKGQDEIKFSESDEDEDAACLVICDDVSNVAIGGNGSTPQVINSDGIYTAIVSTSPEFINDPGSVNIDENPNNLNFYNQVCLNLTDWYGTTVRILNSSNKYIVLHGEGEDKEYDALGGREGSPIDNVWAVGDDTSALIYVGESTVYIEPLSPNLNIDGCNIKDITLKNEKQKDGVIIDKSNLNKVKVTFKSNFYDSVPLIITYEDGEKGEITINRIGLVIQYIYLMANGNQSSIHCECNQSDKLYNYDYEAGEQILIFATYYHPTNDNTLSGSDDLYLNITYDDGNVETISCKDTDRDFNGNAPATDTGVATTSFIIGFMPAHVWDGYTWTDNISDQYFKNSFGNEGGFSATVINAGYNNDKTYGGTQIGSGAGVYWDGHIEWQAR